MNIKEKLARGLLITALLSFSIYLAITISSNKHSMWDFKLYYWGTVAYEQGLNPLELESLRQVINETEHRAIYHTSVLKVGKEFALIPIMFRFYSLFLSLSLDIETLFYLFLAIKLLFLNGLFFLWFRSILTFPRLSMTSNPFLSVLGLSLIIIFSWNRTVWMDIDAGNVSVFEQFFIWFGVLFYLRKKLLPFALCIVAAALWKLVPLLFLSLLFPLFFTEEQKKDAWKAFLVGIGTFIFIHGVSYFLDSEIYTYYIQALQRFSDEERGIENPCIIALLGDLLQVASGKGYLAENSLGITLYGVYAVYTCVIAAIYGMVVHKCKTHEQPLTFVLFTFLTYAMVAPRLKDYAYILLIPPALYLISGKGQKEERFMLFLCIIFPPFFAYYPYMVVALLFFYFVWLECSNKKIKSEVA